MEDLKDRILEVSKELGLSHIGSNISCLPILQEIYENKKPQDKVILDNAHSHLAHLLVRSKLDKLYVGIDDDLIWDKVGESIKKWGIHCDRDAGCDASGGSLGHGIGMGIGMALLDRSKDINVIVSDGSMQEGSNWEALRIASELNLKNLHIYCNFNHYTAVAEIDPYYLEHRMKSFSLSLDIRFYETDNGEGFEGVEGHYKKL